MKSVEGGKADLALTSELILVDWSELILVDWPLGC
jgi:hypothetical protein